MLLNMINGQIAFTSDISLVQILVQDGKSKVIYVGDPVGQEQTIQYYNMIIGSILMPDYNTMECEINGDLQSFATRYYAYLSSESPNMFIRTIIAALYKGTNILLFFPPQAQGLHYPEFLISYLFEVHGLQCGGPDRKFMYSIIFDHINAACLYDINLISPLEYLILAKEYFMEMSNKLVADLNIYVTNPGEVYKYLYTYQQRLINADKMLIKPFSREV